MSTIKTLSNLLQINNRIKDQQLRMLYLKECWGLSQEVIADMEDCSQQWVSSQIIKGRMNPQQVIEDTLDLQFSIDEIRYIQFLPREIIKDIEVIAFVNNILGLEVYHPFYQHYDHVANMRIAALAGLGVQNKHLERMFKKTQSGVSMIVKRMTPKLNIERGNRYDSTAPFQIGVQKRKTNFLLAGGQSV
jgi:transcriptional regulator